ncbi:kinesin-like protein KIF28 isoform X2 [Clavelina lepadiformis]|uniref:kinesin-like protein KIF28 isoform X2 n=2 Tax=Clavelina lepadiformis TaxID=159417 RepID=UPI0040427328
MDRLNKTKSTWGTLHAYKRKEGHQVRSKRGEVLPKVYDYAFGPTAQVFHPHKRKKMGDNVQVAVRLRPFNERERVRNAKLVIKMENNTTTITDPEGKYPEKKYTFDFSYWSHDGYNEREDGYLEPDGSKYADQAKVFDDLGKGVLENAWKGFNCSLFAYGQTGSGKSYSMVGYNPNKGIIPITCEELFKGIEEKKLTDDAEKEAEYQVSVSMLEIYNETVKDLLNVSSFKKGGLRVREHPQKGFYVEQLQVAPVSNYSDIEARIAEGTRNRTLAATNMNATSSRAHTIVAINFAQKAKNEAGKSMTKTSIINLVDLAGSERADSTGATGERLKEGSMINKSLLCLGNCIKALADQQEGKHINVPYRDSILTRLLKNALGGNSKTVMIAALSPADINYDETLSTLRFADRAKSIKTKAIVNESPTDKLIREMKDEIKRLQELLENQGSGAVVVQGVSPNDVEEMRKAQEENLRRNQEEMDMMNQTWQQRLEEQRQVSQKLLDVEKTKQEARKTIPHLWNLNEDPMLTGMVLHLTPPGVSTIGNVDPASIVLKGLNIKKDHAVIENDSNSLIYLTPSGSESKLLINGKEITERIELRHNDRIMFGSNHLYVFHHPQDAAKQVKEGKVVEKVSFNSAQEEIAQNKGFDMNRAGKSKEDMLLQEDLIQIMPMVNEANAISEELDKKMLYEIALISPQARGLKDGRTEVSVKAKKLTNGNEFVWGRNDFIDRKFAMQEVYQMYVEEDEDWDKKHQGDYPFSESDDYEVIIGTCYLYVQSLAYLMDTEDNLAIRSFRGTEEGLMSIEALPFSEAGELLVDEYVEEPGELVGKSIQFMINVKKILALPKRYHKVWCQYKFLLSDEWNKSQEIDASLNSELNFKKMFKTFPVTQQLMDEFENSPVVIQVWGKQRPEPDDPSRVTMTTKELLALEDSVMTYKAPKKAVQNRASHESKELRRKESEINNLHVAVGNAKKAQQEIESDNVRLMRENDDAKREMMSMKRKLELLTGMVEEAKHKGEAMLLVKRMDHILKRGEDLASKEILRLIKQIKQQEKQSVPKKFPGTPPPHKSAPPSPPHHSNGASKRKDSSSSSSRSSTPAKVNKSTKSGVCLLL